MQDIKTFSTPPITEAIFDIQVRLPENLSIDDLENIYDNIADRFPTKDQKYTFQAKLRIPTPAEINDGFDTIPANAESCGFMFRSDIDKKIFQARLDGFTFNKLKPYEDWEVFFAEAQELWKIYRDKIKPIEITRIALRYINRILIPLPLGSFDEYLIEAPKIPDSLPQGLSNLLIQYTIPNGKINAAARVTQTIEKPTEDILPYVFDIDVFKQGPFDINDQMLWQHFLDLRNYKNEIFFGWLTKKAKRLFE